MNGRMAAAVFAVGVMGGVVLPAGRAEAGIYVHVGVGVRHHPVYVTPAPVVVSSPVYVIPAPVVVTRRVYVAPSSVVVYPSYRRVVYHHPRHVVYHHGHHGFGFHFSFRRHHH